jgi:mannose-6-phosphate isomerase-like protein (cupin superfamily)
MSEATMTTTRLGTTPAAKATAFTTYESFEAEARRRGFDTVLERQWAADTVLDTHTHDFGVWARVVQGELWLSCDGQTAHLQPGDEFTLPAGVPHAERYGVQGAAYWVARRSKAA